MTRAFHVLAMTGAFHDIAVTKKSSSRAKRGDPFIPFAMAGGGFYFIGLKIMPPEVSS